MAWLILSGVLNCIVAPVVFVAVYCFVFYCVVFCCLAFYCIYQHASFKWLGYVRQPEQQPDGQALIESDMQILRHRPRRIETQPFSLSTFQPLMKRVYSRIKNTGGRFAKEVHKNAITKQEAVHNCTQHIKSHWLMTNAWCYIITYIYISETKRTKTKTKNKTTEQAWDMLIC